MDGQVQPETIGGYRILSLLGEGAMGTVYLAERRAEVRQQVALKVVKLGMDSQEVLARFDLERQALAVMNHDAIAKVFDAGTTPSGQPYFVMEYVEGIPLSTYCDDHRLSLRERVRLFQQICAGVQHAHQKGVLHRDLKPGNILVGRKDEQHVPKIIDFGLARATNRQLVKHTIFTEQGRMIGTPEYMSPEQAQGNDKEIDTRTDIYSLGAILYQLLSGELPFPSGQLRKLGLLEIQRTLREDDPPRPSTRISTKDSDSSYLAVARRTSPALLRRDLRRDLDWIVMKALSKEPERRYANANELAKDLDNYLEGRPVIARPPSTVYRLRRFVRRYRAQVAAGVLVLLTMVAGFVVSVLFAVRARQLADEYARLLVSAELDAVEHRAAAAHPAWPEEVQELRELVAIGSRLVEDLPVLESALERMREGHVTGAAVQRDRRRGPHPDTTLVEHREAQRALLEAQLQHTNASNSAKSSGRRELADIDAELASLRQRIQLSDRVSLADANERFLYDLLERQASRLQLLAQHTLPDLRSRLEWAGSVRESTIETPRQAWDAAIAAVATSDRYQHMQLRPQTGLVPLGADPVSGLQEFGHPSSGAIPRREKNGRLALDLDSSLVFVLIPAGRIRFGYPQPSTPAAPNSSTSGPEEEQQVGAFFLSKYEMSRAQWERLAHGVRGLRLFDGNILDLRNRFDEPQKPSNGVSCTMAETLLRRDGLVLPREIEWEYACKAGTETIWYTGDDPDSMRGHANLLGPADGISGLAPVVALEANPFGLHQMLGNVMEWCRDAEGQTPFRRALRGGSWESSLLESNSTKRDHAVADDNAREVGVRPARLVF